MAEPVPNDASRVAASAPENPAVTAAKSSAAAPATEPAPVTGIDAELSKLPVHARSIMKVRVPLQVTLASQRKSVKEIIELGPGSIVKFDKTCDQPLELMLGDRPLAHGEVVKVGDKFGLRI